MKCHEKKKWKTEQLAIKAVEKIKEKYGNKMYSYLCCYCDNYHLSSISKEENKRRLKEQQKHRIQKESEYWERKFKIDKS